MKRAEGKMQRERGVETEGKRLGMSMKRQTEQGNKFRMGGGGVVYAMLYSFIYCTVQ